MLLVVAIVLALGTPTWAKRKTPAEREAEKKAKYESATFPASKKNFAGPGTVDGLIKAAMDWMKEDEQFGKADPPWHVTHVAIINDWRSYEQNISGQTIQWALDVKVAYWLDAEKDKDLCHVIECSLLTAKELGVKKAPPFTDVAWTAGSEYAMKKSKLPAASSGGGGCRMVEFEGAASAWMFFLLLLPLPYLVVRRSMVR